MNKRVHIVVSGKVQGVFFRAHVQKMADKLKIKGNIVNRDADKIEAIFEGPAKAVDQILEFCKEGPEEADVAAIVIDEEKYKGEFKGFEVLK